MSYSIRHRESFSAVTVRSGFELLGGNGGGRRWAQGQVNVSGSDLTVSGLEFRPSIIAFKRVEYQSGSGSAREGVVIPLDVIGTQYDLAVKAIGTDASLLSYTITDDGFTLRAISANTFNIAWIAVE